VRLAPSAEIKFIYPAILPKIILDKYKI
jgi:hypothetical protein